MYPKNSVTPPEIDLGQILLIADGTVQTTLANVRVKVGSAPWAGGLGTSDCDATSGIWSYAPTQAETNADYFIVALYKAACTAQSKTVITSASATAGYAGVDWSKVTAPTTTLNLSGTTISTSQAVGSVSGAVGSVTSGVTVSALANNVITAASIDTDAITDAKVASDVTIASVTGNVGGSVASVTSGVTVSAINANTITAASIAADAITDAKVASDVTIASVTGSVGSVASYGTLVSDVATAVWAAGTRSLTTFGTLVSDIWASATRTLTAASDSSGVTTLLTRIVGTLATGTHNPQSGDSFARLGAPAGASISDDIANVPTVSEFNARTLVAADYATSSLLTTVAGYIDTEVSSIIVIANRLDSAMELDGGVYRFTTNALEQAPSGSGPTASAIADAVWDEVLAGHLTAGSTGNALNAAGSSGDPWATVLPGAYGAGSAGKIIGDNVNATISSRASQTSVDDVPTVSEFNARTLVAADYATSSLLTTVAGYLDTEIATIATATVTTIPAQIAALNNLSSAQVVSALGTGSWATAIPWNVAWDAEVQSECADALTVYDPPTNTEMEARTLVSANYATAAEVSKIPRAAGTLAAGATFTRTKTSESSTTLVESLS